MLFDDAFYPDNPKRRQEVANIRGEIVTAFDLFKTAWNTNINLINSILTADKPVTVNLPLIAKDPRDDDMNSCVAEINNAVKTTKEALTKLAQDCGLPSTLPGNWTVDGILTFGDKGTVFKVFEGFGAALGSAASMYLTTFAFNYVKGLFTIASTLSKVVASVSGAIGGLICGAAVFVITDMIASAITGAVERKELKEAIEELQRLRDQVALPLKNSAVQVAAVTQSIRDGVYKIDDRYQIMWNEKQKKYFLLDTEEMVFYSMPAAA